MRRALIRRGAVVAIGVGVVTWLVAACHGSSSMVTPEAAATEGTAASADAAAPTDDAPPAPSDPVGSAAPVTAAAEWPMWGGTPARNMVNTTEKGIPATWDIESKKNIKWTQKLGAQTYGNPVIAGGKILVGTNNEGHRNPDIQGDKGVVMCFQESDGKFLWQMVTDKLEAGRVNDWPEQGVCSSPAIVGDRCYYVSNRCQLVCLDMDGFLDGENDGPFKDEKYTSKIDGDIVWVLDMMDELGVFPHNLATCSPLVVDGVVFALTSNGVERDHITIPNPRAPSFIAVDAKTGEIEWESNAPGENILHGQWAAPSYIEAGGRKQVVFPGGDGWVRSFDPKNGELIWKFDCNPKDSKWELGGRGTRNNLIATPACVDGVVYIAVGQDPEHGEGVGHLYAIDASKTGDVTSTAQLWHYGGKEFKRSISSFAVTDDILYAADLSGFLHCIDRKTGRPFWVYDTFAAVWGSPTVIDGKVYLGDEDGDVVVLKHGKMQEEIAEINMENSVYSTPIAVGGVLYIATRTTLFAIEAE